MRWAAAPLLLIIALLCAACSATPGRASRPLPTSTPPDLAGWRELYRRDGWAGGAALDVRAVGDVMLGRLVGTIARQRGLDYPFAAARPLLAGDLTLGNLEGPLTERMSPLRPGPYRLPASPAFAAPLRAAGFDALALANNHALDVGPQGLQDTDAALRAAGIAPLGAGATADAAGEPFITTTAGLRVGLLAFNDVGDPEDNADEGRSSWGRAWLGDAALARVRAARADADAVVVLVHWGREYAPTPTPRQREWAAKLVEAGADLIVGAHPHVLQPVERIEGGARAGVVAYSLGNFLFDQGDRPETSAGAALRVLLDKEGVALVAAAPIQIVAGQARPLAPESAEGRAALCPLQRDCAPSPSPLPVARAWRWDGETGHALEAPPATPPDAHPRRISVDLRGDGRPLWATLDDAGLVELRDGPAADAPVVWRNEASAWRVTRIDAGDIDGDGRLELFLLLWRPDAGGALGSHPFLVGWRGGRFRVIWGGSATEPPLQDAAVGDLDGDGHDELAVLLGGKLPGDAASSVAVWRWHDWVFEQLWRGDAPGARGLWLRDLDGDGRLELEAN
jgi:poly-gamma-glutamate synthesis protein (capsule biosynthesis protein)